MAIDYDVFKDFATRWESRSSPFFYEFSNLIDIRGFFCYNLKNYHNTLENKAIAIRFATNRPLDFYRL